MLCAITIKAYTQQVEFQAEVSRQTLGQNEQLRVDFKMNHDGDHFVPPSFEGFSVIENKQSIENSIINGKRTFSKSYIFVLQPKQKGTLKIGSASIEIEGKKYKTQPQHINVTDPVKNPKKVSSDIDRQSLTRILFGFDPFDDPFFQREVPEEKIYELSGEDVFITAEISNRNPYINESISVTYKMYIAAILQAQINNIEVPKFNNLVKYNIPLSEEEKQWNTCTYNNKKYHCRVIKQVMLYPQKAGKISIDPLVVNLNLGLPSNLGRMHITNEMVSAPEQKLNVKELPNQAKPEDFSGAVGEFQFGVILSKQEIKENEVTTAEISVSGNGNFNFFELPKPNFPSTLDVYDPDFKENTNQTTLGTRGKVSNSYTIIPQYKGKYPIGSFSFTYFNPKTGKYVTEHSPELTLNVLPNAHKQEVISNTEDKIPAENFYFLKLKADLEPKNKKTFFGSVLFYVLWLLPLLFIPLAILYKKWLYNRENDTEGNRIRRANKLAKKYLSSSRKHLGDKEPFYETLERGLHNYLKAKLQIETSELSKNRIQEILTNKNVEPQNISDFINLLSNCEMARYSPYTQADMQNDYQLASKIISVLDKQIR